MILLFSFFISPSLLEISSILFSAMSPTNHFWAISTSSCCSLDIFSTVVRSSFVSGRV